MKNNISSLSDIYNLVVENYVREYNISASAKELWLDALEPISMEGNVVTLATDTDFKRNTINSIYLEKLEEQFTIVLGNPIKVEIIIKDDIPTTETKFNDIRNSRELTNKIDNIVHDNKVTYTFDNFIVGPSNNLAYAAAKAVSQKQHEKYNPLFIYGDSGLGKTHLLSAIQNEMTKNYPGINIIYISAETFTNEFLHSITANKTELFDEKYRNADALLIDDIQFIAGKEQTEEKFFHIFNELYKLNKAIVLTSDRPAKEIKSISDRLKTRFSSGLAADVRAPEYETRSRDHSAQGGSSQLQDPRRRGRFHRNKAEIQHQTDRRRCHQDERALYGIPDKAHHRCGSECHQGHSFRSPADPDNC